MCETGTLTIGKLMQKSGVSIRTLRYYDSIELLKPSRYTEGGHRLYSKEDLSRLQQIKSLKFLGYSLKEINNMLQKNSASGSEILQSLKTQKKIFIAKKLEIANILTDLDHLIDTIEDCDTININIFCSMLQKLMFEEDTKKWFEDHFSKDITDELFNKNKSEEIDLDRRWTESLSHIKQLTLTETLPSSKEAQTTIESLMNLMKDTTKGNLNLIAEKIPSSEIFSFPNPFTEKEEVFLKEAMEIYRKDKCRFRGWE